MDGRKEVPDSEDEPMTSSPTNISDGDADKLCAMAHVPPQGAQDVPQEASRTHQATPETNANMNTERIEGLGADRNIASINIDGTKINQSDLQPTIIPSQPAAAYIDTADNHRPDTVMLPPGNTLAPSEDATVTNTAQTSNGRVPQFELGTDSEAASISETSSTSAHYGIAYRDPRVVVDPQLAIANGQVPIDDAEEQSAAEATRVSTNLHDGMEALVAGPSFKDNSKNNESRKSKVGATRSNERRSSHNALGTAVDFRHVTPRSEEVLLQFGSQKPEEGKGDGADGAAQKLAANEGLHADAKTSSGTVDTMNAKHAVNIDDANNNSNISAAKPSLHFQERFKEASRAETTLQDLTTSTSTVSGTESWAQEQSNDSSVAPRTTTEPKSTSVTHASSQASMPGTIAASAESGTDLALNPDAAHACNGGPVQSRGEDQAGPSSLLIQPKSKPTTDTVSNYTVPVVDTTAKTQQETTLDELKAQKSAMLASLAALPAIRVLMEENASTDASMADVDDEATEVDIMAAANKIVKEHIKLLHEYNELKDVGQGLMGLIADQRGVRIVEVQEEFGIEAQD